MAQQKIYAIDGFQEKVKPLLRGWSHAVATVASIALTIVICWLSRGDFPRLLSMLIFGLSMIELYTVSAVYHIINWSKAKRRVWRAIDHANIFVLIAGTYTPLCFNILTGWVRVAILIVIWTLALVGIVSSIFTLKLPRWANAALYAGLGCDTGNSGIPGRLALDSRCDPLPWRRAIYYWRGDLRA